LGLTFDVSTTTNSLTKKNGVAKKTKNFTKKSSPQTPDLLDFGNVQPKKNPIAKVQKKFEIDDLWNLDIQMKQPTLKNGPQKGLFPASVDKYNCLTQSATNISTGNQNQMFLSNQNPQNNYKNTNSLKNIASERFVSDPFDFGFNPKQNQRKVQANTFQRQNQPTPQLINQRNDKYDIFDLCKPNTGLNNNVHANSGGYQGFF